MASSESQSEVAQETPSANHVVGCVRRFNNKLGFGFITVVTEGTYKGKDIFVHQTSIKQDNAGRFRMLFIGECVEFDVGSSSKEEHQYQAINVTGFNGNSLMCENSSIMFRVHNGRNGHNDNGHNDVRRDGHNDVRRDSRNAGAQGDDNNRYGDRNQRNGHQHRRQNRSQTNDES